MAWLFEPVFCQNPWGAWRLLRHQRAMEFRVLVLFTSAIFLSAALLFVVEPMFARMVLPLLGGSPAVWNTTLAFYQATLLLGYAYAHALSRLRLRTQALVHFVVLLLPAFALPIAVARFGTPTGDVNPIPWLLGLLVSAIGLPFFVMSTGSAVLQRWFARTNHGAARDPYFLYAVSNLGGLLGLLAYPVVVEPRLTLADQSRLWTTGYVVAAVLTVACAVSALLSSSPPPVGEATPTESTCRESPAPIGWRRRLRWVVWAFLPSSLLLGVTTHLTSDVGSLPLLWVAPLALYLITFTIAFGYPSLAPRSLMIRALLLVVVLVTITMAAHATEPFVLILALDLALLALMGLVFHGLLAEDRPTPMHLTEFYLWVASGGVLGGISNSLIAPVIFSSVAEYPIVLVLACLMIPRLPRYSARDARSLGWLDAGTAGSRGCVDVRLRGHGQVRRTCKHSPRLPDNVRMHGVSAVLVLAAAAAFWPWRRCRAAGWPNALRRRRECA